MSLEQMVDQAEHIGVIGSPSSTSRLTVDILGVAADKHLVGSLSIMRFTQGGKNNYALGQITEVSLNNPFIQDPTMRSIIRQRGTVEPITERQDTHTAQMLISSVFEEGDGVIDSGMFSTVPPTGTPIRVINQDIVDRLVGSHSDHISYIGKILGTDIYLPSLFRHFGSVASGGLGEAAHIGVFGKSGSGKSVLAKMIIASYLKHKQMTILVIDPQGEFSKMKNDSNLLKYFKDVLGREIEFHDLTNILMLSDKEIFKQVLIKSGFIKELGVRLMDNQLDAADEILKILNHEYGSADGLGRIPIYDAYPRAVFEHVLDRLSHVADGRHIVLERIYTSEGPRGRVIDTIARIKNDQSLRDLWFEKWQSITNLFGREKFTPNLKLLLDSLGERAHPRCIVINLSQIGAPKKLYWDEDIQKISINQILSRIEEIAKEKYLEGGALNALIVLDEAHEFAPRERYQTDESRELRDTLTKAVRETRKYNLGWMFISQTLSSLDRKIIEQLRMYFVGYGLAYGVELQGIQELLGGNKSAINLYQQFQDPKSGLSGSRYPFMAIGPTSPMSFSAIPLFFNSLNYPDEFLQMQG